MSSTSPASFKEPSNGRTLDLKISDPVSMLNEIARRYESTERILMEYIDNALDDVEVLYRDHHRTYPYEVHIEVVLDSLNRTVTIRDNCRGMTGETLERIIRNVGESEKRGLTWVNGRFGFGVQAFRAAADTIHFQTRQANHPHLVLSLQRDQHHGIQGARPVTDEFPSNTGTGTVVRITDFEEEWFEEIAVGSIKQEIESHFERLLARPNLIITVQEIDEAPVRCEPFRYQEVPGTEFQRTLRLRYKGEIYPIEVYLKVADVEVPGRIVRFFARGRRINEVAEIKSFIRKSDYRTSVWGHPHLLGYIEVGELVRPVITRDDFVRNQNRQIFYDAILGLEGEIKQALDRINEAQRDTTLSRLEDVLRQVLQRVAREDRREIRLHMAQRRHRKQSNRPATEFVSETNNPPANRTEAAASTGTAGQVGAAGLPSEIRPPTAMGQEADERGLIRPQATRISGLQGDELKVSYQAETDQDRPKPASPRRSGFDIQFFDIPPDAEGQVRRSHLVGSTIYINVAHPAFQERMTYTRQGRPRVTDRLSAYIAATVSIHYKDQFYAQYGQAPERREILFDEQVDFMFRLESALREHLPVLERELARQSRQEVGED